MTHLAIALNSVRFYYPDHPNETVIDISDWSLAKGERAFVHGPSGCGKSTLLSLLGGLLSPNEGLVNVLGQNLEQLSGYERDQFRAQNIGYVFQQFNLIPYLNAVDNIRLANHFAKQKILQDQVASLLTRLNIQVSDWHKPARNLSVGQQQRVAIARALINQPEILIADEPTSSLDQANRDAFMQLLIEIVQANNITLLCVSHDLSLSKHFNRVETFNDFNHQGKIV